MLLCLQNSFLEKQPSEPFTQIMEKQVTVMLFIVSTVLDFLP